MRMTMLALGAALAIAAAATPARAAFRTYATFKGHVHGQIKPVTPRRCVKNDKRCGATCIAKNQICPKGTLGSAAHGGWDLQPNRHF